MPTRLRNYSYDVPGSRTTTWVSGPTPLPGPQTDTNQKMIQFSMNGVYSQSGQRPYKFSNPHSYNIHHCAEWRGEFTQFYPVPGLPEHRMVTKGCFSSNSAHGYRPAWERGTLYERALSKLNDKARGSLDLSISLAESGQTYRMTKSVGKFMDFAKYAGLGGFVAGTRAAANGWLQYRYGWKPLMSDIFQAADEGIRIVINKLEHFHAKEKIPMMGMVNPLQSVNGVAVPTEVEMTGVQSARFSISLRMPDGTHDPTRWTSMNPISIGWELIPYSFVFDWFVNVGGYLRNIETALLYNTRFHSGCLSEIYAISTEEHVNFYQDKDPGNTNRRWEKFSCFSRDVSFVRTVLTGYPSPRRPTFQVDLGSGKLITAAALLRQMLKK